MSDLFDQVYTRVCHVKQGYEDREEHIRREFAARGVPVHFYLDHDIPDIDPARLDAAPMRPGEYSIALKHIGVWRDFLRSGKPYCLVFEDDVFLASDFVQKLAACLGELGDPDRLAAVYLGNGCNYYIAASDLEPGRHLYPATTSRCADSYLITRPVAEARLEWLSRNDMTRGIDHQINIIDAEAGVEVLWFERPIVEQGSQNGAFKSSLNGKARPLWMQRVEWAWKRMLRQARGKVDPRMSKPTRSA